MKFLIIHIWAVGSRTGINSIGIWIGIGVEIRMVGVNAGWAAGSTTDCGIAGGDRDGFGLHD